MIVIQLAKDHLKAAHFLNSQQFADQAGNNLDSLRFQELVCLTVNNVLLHQGSRTHAIYNKLHFVAGLHPGCRHQRFDHPAGGLIG